MTGSFARRTGWVDRSGRRDSGQSSSSLTSWLMADCRISSVDMIGPASLSESGNGPGATAVCSRWLVPVPRDGLPGKPFFTDSSIAG